MHTNVPALGNYYPQRKEEEQDGGPYPSIGGEGRGFVQVCLIYLPPWSVSLLSLLYHRARCFSASAVSPGWIHGGFDAPVQT